MTTAAADTPVRTDHHALYRALVLDHARAPRNFGVLQDATHSAEGINPLCGDKLELTLAIDADGRIARAAFEGTGCAISIASASILTELVEGLRVDEALQLFDAFDRMLSEDPDDRPAELADSLRALSGVRRFPSRIKCATLAWHALASATSERGGTPVTTE